MFEFSTSGTGLQDVLSLYGSAKYNTFEHLQDDPDNTSVPLLGAEYLNKPILGPAIFSTSALEEWMEFSTGRKNTRALSEIGIRRELDIDPVRNLRSEVGESLYTSFTQSNDSTSHEFLSDTEENYSQGSDSDPSADELPLKEILRSGGLRDVLKSDGEVLKLLNAKRKKNKYKRPSSASAAKIHSIKYPGIRKLIRSASATRRAEGASNSTPNIPIITNTKHEILANGPHVHRRSLRAYEKSNYTKVTESVLRKQAMEPFVILSPERYHDTALDDTTQRYRRQASEEAFQPSRTLPLPKVPLRQRGIFFPDSGRLMKQY